MAGGAVEVDIDARRAGAFPPLPLPFLAGLLPMLKTPLPTPPAAGEHGAVLCGSGAAGVAARDGEGGRGGDGCCCCVETGKLNWGDGGVPSEDVGETVPLVECCALDALPALWLWLRLG